MAWNGTQYTITATAAKLSTILGLNAADLKRFKQIDIKNASGAANVLYLGPSTVTNVPANARVELSAGQAYSFDPGGGAFHVSTEEIFLVGTANAANIAFISLLD